MAGSSYTIRLPFKRGRCIDIDDSLPIVAALHAQMECRLHFDSEISKQSYDFLQEYLELVHMGSITENAATLFKPVRILHYVMRDSRLRSYALFLITYLCRFV